MREMEDDVRSGWVPDARFNALGVACLAVVGALLLWGVRRAAETAAVLREESRRKEESPRRRSGERRAGDGEGGDALLRWWWLGPAVAGASAAYAATLVFPREVCVYTRTGVVRG